MPEAFFNFRIITPESRFFDEKVSSIVISGTEGFFGVLANHVPFIATTRPGKIAIKTVSNQEKNLYATSEGFFKFSDNTATLLINSVNTVSPDNSAGNLRHNPQEP